MEMNKKGQNSTIGVIIAIVLGVALIVFLIWGFSSNWSMFRSTSSSYTGDQLTIAKDACQQQCDAGLESQYCSGPKVIDAKGTKDTCSNIEGVTCSTISCS